MLSRRADADSCASSVLSLTSRCKMPVETALSTMLTAGSIQMSDVFELVLQDEVELLE